MATQPNSRNVRFGRSGPHEIVPTPDRRTRGARMVKTVLIHNGGLGIRTFEIQLAEPGVATITLFRLTLDAGQSVSVTEDILLTHPERLQLTMSAPLNSPYWASCHANWEELTTERGSS